MRRTKPKTLWVRTIQSEHGLLIQIRPARKKK